MVFNEAFVGNAIIIYTADTLVCLFNIWFLPADCGDPSLPVNGVVMANDSTLEGSQTLFQCSPGFVPSQQMMSVCMADGNWTPNPAGLECGGRPESI